MIKWSAVLVLGLGACASSEVWSGKHRSPAGGEQAAASPPAVMPPGTGETARSAVPSSIPLLTGDVLRITVFRQRDLDLEVRIPEGGEFAYPLIGEVKAVGRTTKEIEKEIKAALEERYLRHASVAITVVQYSPRTVYVLGAVHRPSPYDFQVNRRLTVLQLISTAGGLTDRATKELAQLLRRKENGERELVQFSLADVERAVAEGRVDADLEVKADDLLVIPAAGRLAYVLGQVQKPGAFELPLNTRVTVSMAVSQAGSWTKFAATSRIQVLRQNSTGDPTKFTIDLDAVVDGHLEMDLELVPGDVVCVPARGIF